MKRKATFQLQSQAKKPNLVRQASVVMVKRVKTDERKNIDVSSTTSIVLAQTTAQLLLLNGVDDGATPLTRIGRRINMTSLEIRWIGSLAAASAGASPLRLVVIYDKQSNAVAPTAADVFAADVIYSTMNLANSRRFKVVVDELVECVGTAGPQGWNRKIWRDFTAKGTKEGLQVEFNDNSTATITSIISGSLYAFWWQNGNIITASPTNGFLSRVRFTDN